MAEKVKSMTVSQGKRKDNKETGKYMNFTDEKGRKACLTINQDTINNDLKIAVFNLLVTSEIKCLMLKFIRSIITCGALKSFSKS